MSLLLRTLDHEPANERLLRGLTENIRVMYRIENNMIEAREKLTKNLELMR